jgi:glycosyltransferase involved in cell wall biosynthesis
VPDRKDTNTAIVIIGRNEGRRLVRCLDSLKHRASRCVYVDSASTDNSVREALARDMEVVQLDMSVPFTAARARNAGYRRIVDAGMSSEYVQFVDGDCQIALGWFRTAQEFLDAHPEVGIVFGMQREFQPGRSVYNMLLDIEWDTPIGDVTSSGGLLFCRRTLFEQLGGFREDLIAGEDPEFCLRARLTGARVWHLPRPMALHDGEMTRFSQWWKRSKRTGYAYAEGFALHGAPPVHHYARELRSVYIWSLFIPALVVSGATLISPWCLAGVLAYPLQVARVALRGRRSARVNWLYAFFVVLGKVPELHGILRFNRDRLRRRKKLLIEYK